jgi:hypothetical protein
MSDADGYAVARAYTRLDALAKKLGSRLDAPFMTLAFMALLVIPDLKLSDRGLFSGTRWAFQPLFEGQGQRLRAHNFAQRRRGAEEQTKDRQIVKRRRNTV